MVMFCQMLESVARESATNSATPRTRFFEQCRVRGFQRHIRTAAHCHSDIRGRKRRRVVDAVADHCDRAGLLQVIDDRELGVGQKLGLHFEAKGTSDCGARAPVVAGQHHRSNSKRVQPRDAGRRVLAGFVSQGNEPNDAFADQHDNDGLTFTLKRLDAGRHIVRQHPEFGRITGRTHRDEALTKARGDCLARDSVTAEVLRNSETARLSRREDREAERMA